MSSYTFLVAKVSVYDRGIQYHSFMMRTAKEWNSAEVSFSEML